MKPHIYSSEGIVLARKNFGEADRILSVFSKDQGRISLLAKGVRRPKSKKRGHIEIFNLIKYQANIGHGIDIISEAEVIRDYKDIRKNLKKISLAYYFMEVAGKITHEGESNTGLYYLLTDSLENISITKTLRKLRTDFIFKLLTLLGYWPVGKTMENHDRILEEVIERQITSVRVGKRMLS